MSKHRTTGLGLRLLAGAGVLVLAGCGDDAQQNAAQKTALEYAPVIQPSAQVIEPASTALPTAQFAAPTAPEGVPALPAATVPVVSAKPEIKPAVKSAVKPEMPPVAAATKAEPRVEAKVALQPVPALQPEPAPRQAALKPATTLRVAPAADKIQVTEAAKVATEWPKPVQTKAQIVTQIHIRPAQVTSQPTAPMPWLKPFEFNGVNNQSAPTPVARTAGYEPRPNPYANAYVPQPVQAVPLQMPWGANMASQQGPAVQAASFSLGSMMPISYDSNHSLQDFLPTIKKVYPTGEKPMVVVTFKCPTEGLGIATPSTKILHGAVDTLLGGVNATNVLPWTIQQVCS